MTPPNEPDSPKLNPVDASNRIFELIRDGIDPEDVKKLHPELEPGWEAVNRVCKANAASAKRTLQPAPPRGSGTSLPRPSEQPTVMAL